MADFVQTMKDWRRMCDTYTTDDAARCCQGCPMDGRGCGAIYEGGNADPEVIEREVNQWAAEHPEPVFPMWCEWLADKGVVDVARMPVDYSGGIITEIKPSGKMYEHIPADLARKLGIEPKEG